jgi:negative regulator of replication initiation
MRAIEVSDEVYQKLQAVAIPLQDNANSVIERLLAQAAEAGRRPSVVKVDPALPSGSDDGNYTHKRPVSFSFDGGSDYAVSTYKELYLLLCREMAKRHADSFDRVLGLRGRERSYFSASSLDLTHPQRVEGTNYFAETNFSARNMIDRCRDVLKLFGYDPASLRVETRPVGQ